ncbi:hypothetical protein OAB00_04495 [Akkermansiaceae bacterium]|nr:hypothetical protein [Akkermansiaceae bacterium]
MLKNICCDTFFGGKESNCTIISKVDFVNLGFVKFRHKYEYFNFFGSVVEAEGIALIDGREYLIGFNQYKLRIKMPSKEECYFIDTDSNKLSEGKNYSLVTNRSHFMCESIYSSKQKLKYLLWNIDEKNVVMPIEYKKKFFYVANSTYSMEIDDILIIIHSYFITYVNYYNP